MAPLQPVAAGSIKCESAIGVFIFQLYRLHTRTVYEYSVICHIIIFIPPSVYSWTVVLRFHIPVFLFES